MASACSLGSTSHSRRSPVYMFGAFCTLFFVKRRAGVGFDVFLPRSVELSPLLLPRCVDMSGSSSGVWLESSCFGSALRLYELSWSYCFQQKVPNATGPL